MIQRWADRLGGGDIPDANRAVIAPGYDKELDELRSLSENANDFLLEYENRQREESPPTPAGREHASRRGS